MLISSKLVNSNQEDSLLLIWVFLYFSVLYFHKLKYRTKMIPLDKVDLSQDVDMKEFEKNIK